MANGKRSTDREDSENSESAPLTTSRRRLMQVAGGVGAGSLISNGTGVAQKATDDNVIKLEAAKVKPDGEDQQSPPKNAKNRSPPNHANKPEHRWIGVEPEKIADQRNPTLSLVAGEQYTVEWTNTDGRPHNFTIEDTNGKKVLSTKVQPKKGTTQTVEFTATEEMAEYYCQPHKHDMRGAIQVGKKPSLEVNILVFSATAGYRHKNIEYGVQQLKALKDRIATETGADSVTIETIPQDASAFPSNASELEQYDTIVWFNTTGDVLNADQQAAFEQYIQNGGGYAGIHAAADTEYDWSFYGDMLGGAYFADHPAVQEAEVNVTDKTHPSTEHLPDRWTATDEWYDYAENPRGDVHVLASVNEDSYTGATMSRSDHPIAWCRKYRGGRAWYTGRGHTEDAFDEDAFLEHILGGILWSGGFVEGDASGTVWSSYQKTQLTSDVSEPMKMDMTPDGRLFYTERATGKVGIIHPDSDEITTALTLDVYSEQEDGLQGIAFDPDFEENSWVYLYYAPPMDVVGDQPYNVLSRFKVEGDTINPDTETEILRVPTQRETCCHVGGAIEFGSEGKELYLSTGDDTNPFASSGYTPIDERSGTWPEDSDNAGIPYAYWDAQRTAGNTNDLRGSILRIIPQDDGSYEIPDGNLFTGDEYAQAREDGLVREEIYVMGCRNPFTLTVDDESGLLYYADYGPDSGSWSADRGPPGIVEFRVVNEAQYAGWPYVRGPNIPYVDYNFATGESGDPFDPENPVNTSPNNDGLKELPPVTESTIYYPKGWDEFINNVPSYAQEFVPDQNPWPSLPPGGAPTSGPVYRTGDGGAEGALPQSFDGKWFIMEWGADWLKYITFDKDGNVLEVAPFLPNYNYKGPMDLTVGPDGVLYLMEYGEGFFGGTNPGIYRIDHLAGLLGSDALSFTLDSGELAPGESTTATTILTNLSNSEIKNIQFTLTADSDQIQISAPDQTSFSSLAPGEAQSVEWQVTVTEETTEGEYSLIPQVTYTQSGNKDQIQQSASLAVTASDGGGGGGGGSGAIDPATTIQLDGLIDGWEGTAPDSLTGQTNPTLTLQEGGEYQVKWTNSDGAPHDFALQDADGNNLAKTDIVSEEGATTSLTFVASAEMVQYVCTVHPNAMVGNIEIV
ncbi:ThuA domain-containing protein [Halomicrococcus sp. NG-SE-24]|uniref:ThuA domain-containing protein n=1 Tax=Halomicrococcus sp. NG-SE-24 TaxID=3436928 RepID=UPI003D99CA7B